MAFVAVAAAVDVVAVAAVFVVDDRAIPVGYNYYCFAVRQQLRHVSSVVAAAAV